jgi:predicted RNA-binding Zn-ribbon protein involved in translation (DUF1610 family)
MRPNENVPTSEQKTDLLCDGCGEAFSAFLTEMAKHNAKVTACPKCGKHHDFNPPRTNRAVPRVRSIKKSLKTA